MSVRQRLMKRVAPEPNTGCWLWAGALSGNGYGKMKVGPERRMASVHRLAYEAFRGPIPRGLFVLHACDVRCCVNPDHLFLGTHADNMRDMTSKARSASGARHGSRKPGARLRRGEAHGRARLTVALVIEIRAAYARGVPASTLAEHYGVGKSTVEKVVTRKTWRHVTPSMEALWAEEGDSAAE